MYLYANGDSFVYGMECLGDNDRTPENKKLSFPYHLKEELNFEEYINNAYNGATNEFIFRRTIIDLVELEFKGIDPQDVFVVIGWSGLCRTEVDAEIWMNKITTNRNTLNEFKKDLDAPEYNKFGNFFLNPSSGKALYYKNRMYDTKNTILPFLVDYFWKESLELEQQTARLIALHQFLKSKGYKHIFLNTFESFEKIEIAKTIPEYFEPNSTFHKWASDNYKPEMRKWNHFSPVPHKEYAKRLAKFIKENKFLD